MIDVGGKHGRLRGVLATCVLISMMGAFALPAAPQKKPVPAKNSPGAALSETLVAACHRDESAFASHLTSQSSALFLKLPETQRSTLMGRLAMLNAAGRALLSTSGDGHTVVRCDAAGAITELRFGAADTAENLAFVPVEAQAAGATRNVRFGLVRESGDWRLLSVGLLLLDIPAMSQEWAEGDIRAGEMEAVRALRELADALETYRKGFDKLPESLDQLGPAPKDGISPDRANLVSDALAAGESGGYRFRYVIVPADLATGAGENERDQAAAFALAATPVKYGEDGRRSFYLDSAGTLRGADKHGAVATADDPRVADPRL